MFWTWMCGLLDKAIEPDIKLRKILKWRHHDVINTSITSKLLNLSAIYFMMHMFDFLTIPCKNCDFFENLKNDVYCDVILTYLRSSYVKNEYDLFEAPWTKVQNGVSLTSISVLVMKLLKKMCFWPSTWPWPWSLKFDDQIFQVDRILVVDIGSERTAM